MKNAKATPKKRAKATKATKKTAKKRAPNGMPKCGEMLEIPAGELALDVKRFPWCVGMTIAYYRECLEYWNEVCPKLEGWGLDPKKVGCNEWIGTWVAYGRGVNQNKCKKRMLGTGFALPAPKAPKALGTPVAPAEVEAS